MSSIIIDVYQDVKNGETVGTGLSKNTFTNGAGYIFATVVAGTRWYLKKGNMYNL